MPFSEFKSSMKAQNVQVRTKSSVLNLEQKQSRIMEGSRMSDESLIQAVGPERPVLWLPYRTSLDSATCSIPSTDAADCMCWLTECCTIYSNRQVRAESCRHWYTNRHSLNKILYVMGSECRVSQIVAIIGSNFLFWTIECAAAFITD